MAGFQCPMLTEIYIRMSAVTQCRHSLAGIMEDLKGENNIQTATVWKGSVTVDQHLSTWTSVYG